MNKFTSEKLSAAIDRAIEEGYKLGFSEGYTKCANDLLKKVEVCDGTVGEGHKKRNEAHS